MFNLTNKYKPKRDATFLLSNWQNFTMVTSRAGEDVRKWASSCITGGKDKRDILFSGNLLELTKYFPR